MQTEDQIRKTEYAKALNRIKELECELVKFNRNNNELREELAKKDKRIDELEREVEDLELTINEQAIFTPENGMSLIELMELESVVGEITFH